MNPSDQPTPTSTVRTSWPFSLDNIRAALSGYPAAARDALISFFLWCIDPRHPLAKPEAARRVGCSDNLLYKLYTGKYTGANGEQLQPADDLIKSIKAFLAIEKERAESGDTVFVLTPTSKKVGTACELARESNSIVFIWGPSQIGKTWSLQYHAAEHNHGRTIYVRFTAASGRAGMVKRIAAACGISDRSNTEDLIERIKRAITKDTLMLFDECHLLFNTIMRQSADRCFETLRDIFDETGCGMVWCFTILDEMKARSGAQLQQAWRRGVHKVPLPLMPTKGDLTSILEHNGLEFPAADLSISTGTGSRSITDKPYEILRQLAKTEGLKAITERLRYGRKLANKANEKLTWPHVLDAHFRIAKQAEQEGEWK